MAPVTSGIIDEGMGPVLCEAQAQEALLELGNRGTFTSFAGVFGQEFEPQKATLGIAFPDGLSGILPAQSVVRNATTSTLSF